MSKLPISQVDIELLRLFCSEASILLKKSPSLTTKDTLTNIEKMLLNEERYGITKKLLDAISQIIYSRIIYGEIPLEESVTMLLDVASGDLSLVSPQSRIPHFTGPPQKSFRPKIGSEVEV